MTPTTLSPARRERLALCDLFDQVGPDAPTLCEGWTAFDLAAHLVVRERDPIGAAGILVPPLAGVTEQAMQRARQRHGFDGLVRLVREGPPVGPFRWFEDQVNLNEYVVHHEDVRRGDGTTGPRDPGELGDVAEAVWHALERLAKLVALRVRGIPLVLEWPGHAAITVKRGADPVVLRGEPIELALYVNGRKHAAAVDLTGPQNQIDTLAAANLSI